MCLLFSKEEKGNYVSEKVCGGGGSTQWLPTCGDERDVEVLVETSTAVEESHNTVAPQQTGIALIGDILCVHCRPWVGTGKIAVSSLHPWRVVNLKQCPS